MNIMADCRLSVCFYKNSYFLSFLSKDGVVEYVKVSKKKAVDICKIFNIEIIKV